jgi:hypothetical protein
MATLAFSVAGQFVGGLVGGPFGATIGRALGALAGSAVDGALFGEKPQAAGADIRLQGSSEGGAIPRLYGWARLSGNIIWARELELLGEEGGGAKGMGAPDGEEIAASFAVAFCEGPVHRLGRIWADGQLLETEGLTLRFYGGSEEQLPDGLIEATQGDGHTPAYRGICYLVVEQLPLGRFGNRIPQLSVELCRAVGDLEPSIRAVTVIPGATEFGYDPTPRLRIAGPGRTESENAHLAAGLSDWTLSIDELVALCPNLEHVALVVTWFGDDLRCGHCQITPRVEAAARSVEGVEWSVAGQGRGEVPVVSTHDGGPAYGGTPSDGAVLAAIADLKARGLKVTLYPLVMMDIPGENGLPDPHGWGEQASYPWRGRITCHPAPGQSGSPDQTGVAAAQVAAFAASYRDMVLHYAGLADEAGGVDALIIGSELRGLTTVRGSANSFPFVEALVTLAGDVRAIVGSATKLTYAADWSEYGGYQPAGEKFFHLDPLWASPNIDAVGIDNYMPVADWRDKSGHEDAAVSAAGYDLEYLRANIAGGEGFDWYYGGDAERSAQVREPITDGAYGEPWVWRFKDIRNWWSHYHHDRPAGVRKATPTAWVPGSKPIWFTELGCAAVDKGANQPNIFGDAKSAEGGRPYFSAGTPDALIQRQFLRAHQRHWRDPSVNPAGMVDVDRIYLWTWDARPYPAFPAFTEVWADGENHGTGHWLTGRLGGASSEELAEAIAADHGVAVQGAPAAPLMVGYVLGAVGSGREALEPVLAATGLSLRSGTGGLVLGASRDGAVTDLLPEALVREDGPVLSRRRGDPAERPGRLALTFTDRERDYGSGTVTAVADAVGPLAGESMAMAFAPGGARTVAERLLDAARARRESAEFIVPPNALSLEPGDLVSIAGEKDGPFEVTEVRDGAARRVTARTLTNPEAVAVEDGPTKQAPAGVAVRAIPLVVAAHLPPLPDKLDRSRLVLAAFAEPWPGTIRVTDEVTFSTLVDLTRRGTIGALLSPAGVGPVSVWDQSNALEVELLGGHLSSASEAAVLAGSNRLALETEGGGWEVVGFAEAELTGPRRYRLTGFQRGLEGTEPGPAAAGARVIALDGRQQAIAVAPRWIGQEHSLRAYARSNDLAGTAVNVDLDTTPLLPLAPVNLGAERQENGDVALSWVRRSRAEPGWGTGEPPLDHAPESYEVSIIAGGVPLRVLQTSGSSASYALTEQLADWGVEPASFTFTVAQRSAVFGLGRAATGEFHD